MTLLAPWFLALAAAVGVPLYVHLARRRRAERIPFPAVRWLATAEREQRRLLDVQQRLLLALRVLALLLLALAAARPLVSALGGRPPLALAIVLDNSMSTARRTPAGAADRSGEGPTLDRPLLEALVADARALLDAQAAGARLWLLTADGRVQAGDRAALRAALDSVRPFAGAGDLSAALARARRLVPGAEGLAPAIALLTDGQAGALDTASAATTIPTVALVRRLRAAGDTAAPNPREVNRAVQSLRVAPRRWTGQGIVSFRVASDAAGGDSVPWRIVLDGQPAARGLALPGTTVAATVGTTARGWVAGEVVLPPDALPLDDVRPFVADVRPPTVVRVDPTAGPFAGAAVATLRDARLVGDAGSGPDRTRALGLTRSDVATALPAVLLPPATPGQLAQANRTLARLGVPWQWSAFVTDSGVAVLRDSLLAAGRTAPVVTRRVRLIPLAGPGTGPVDTIATVGGEPWIVAGRGYLLVGSPLDPSAGSLVLSAGFVPWLGARLATGLEAAQPVWTLGPTRAVPPDFPCDTVRTTNGRTEVLGRDLGDIRRGPREPGVYLCAGGARSAALVITAEDEESVGTTMGDEAVRTRLGSTRATVVTRRAALIDAVATQPGGRPVTPWLLAAALLALAAESAIARGWLGARGARAAGAVSGSPGRAVA